MVYFTRHRRFEITNIVHRKVWDHRHTAIRAVVHRNTASKKNKRVNTATPETPINHLEWSRGNLTIINGNGKLFLKNIKKKYGYSIRCHADLNWLGSISITCDGKLRFCHGEVNIFIGGNNLKAVSLVSNPLRTK